jgi:hypothetical protein
LIIRPAAGRSGIKTYISAKPKDRPKERTKEDVMRKVSFVIAAALALTALSGREAAAAAYCAYSGGATGGWENCGFYTWEQCLANVSGMGGYCMRNPHDPALRGYPVARRPYPYRSPNWTGQR